MNSLGFLFGLLCLISFDCMLGFIIFVFYKYFDGKYFSHLEINLLKEENKYLKDEMLKLNGSTTDFWSDK